MLPDSRIRIVSGKGGVGKSVVALAMARLQSRQGKRTLLCEVNAHESSVQLLGKPASQTTIHQVDGSLYSVNLTAQECVREYALMTLKFRALYNAVFENRVVKYFIRAIPSLGEFVMLGKIWYEEQNGGWDAIIVDAPATGHLISWLRVPQVFTEMISGGPLHKSAQDFRAMLEDPKRTRLDIVTLPEEMPVNEAIEIDNAAKKFGFATRGLILANRVLAPQTRLFAQLRTQEHWREVGEGYLARLPVGPQVRLNKRTLPLATAADIDTLAEEIKSQL
jgi:anion-transporting  ArsA/GET3 family ATPase